MNEAETKQLTELWGTMPIKDICVVMGKSRSSITYTRTALGLKPYRQHEIVKCRDYTHERYFCEAEDEYIKANYQRMNYPAMGKALGRSAQIVAYRVRALKLPPKLCKRDHLLISMTAQLGEPLLERIEELKMPRKVLSRHVGAESISLLAQVIDYLRKKGK